MKTKISIILSVVLFLLTFGIAGAQILPTPQTQVPLAGTTIPKFVEQLPVAGGISVVNATAGTLAGIPSTPAYNIHISEFQSQILPTVANWPAAPATCVDPADPAVASTASWVWGYLTDADVAAQPAIRPSFLGPVVVAQRNCTATPRYINELPLTSNVLPLLPIDMTLDWANPWGIDCQSVLDPLTGLFNYTNPVCGVIPVYDALATNSLKVPTAVHLHGGEVEPAYDGGPDAWTTPGNSPTGPAFPGENYIYPNGQQEGTIWFHDHALGITRLNVYAGLAGIYPIMDMDFSVTPPTAGTSHAIAQMPAFPQHDIPLIIQDRSFDTSCQIFYNLASNPQPNPTVHPFWIPEFIGDTIAVNGKTWPNLNVEPRQYRFRLLNGSNARFYDLSLKMPFALPPIAGLRVSPLPALPFIAIATDGGYLMNAVSTPNIIIGPGERYEVIVDFTGLAVGTQIFMKNSARTPFPGGAKPTANGTDTVMRFTVVANTSGLPITTIANGTPIRPTPLEPIIDGFTAGTNITRQLTLNEVIGPGGPLEIVVNNSKFNLNLNTPGCPGSICRETELPAVGDTEIWEIINITADAHPMHTHLVTFQILDRTPFQASTWITQYDALLLANNVPAGGGPPNQYNVKNADGAIGGNPAIGPFLQLNKRKLPLAYENGWKDTAIMYPGEVTRIVVRWAPQDIPVASSATCTATPTTPGCAGVNSYPFIPNALINGVGYVWHCHIIDHEDNEMMRNYTVGTARQLVCAAGNPPVCPAP